MNVDQKKLENLNRSIRDIVAQPESGKKMTPIRSNRLKRELDRLQYQRSEMIALEDLKMEFDLTALIDHLIFDNIVSSLDWILSKKTSQSRMKAQDKKSHILREQELKESVFWIMDDAEDSEKEKGLTFNKCCTILKISPGNIRYCLYAASKRSKREILKVREQVLENGRDHSPKKVPDPETPEVLELVESMNETLVMSETFAVCI
jgi:hypothetical protein